MGSTSVPKALIADARAVIAKAKGRAACAPSTSSPFHPTGAVREGGPFLVHELTLPQHAKFSASGEERMGRAALPLPFDNIQRGDEVCLGQGQAKRASKDLAEFDRVVKNPPCDLTRQMAPVQPTVE